jgi:hypothetical protein
MENPFDADGEFFRPARQSAICGLAEKFDFDTLARQT